MAQKVQDMMEKNTTGEMDSVDVESILISVSLMEDHLKKTRERATRAEMEVKKLREIVQKDKGDPLSVE